MLNRSRLAAISVFLIVASFSVSGQQLSFANLPPDTSFVFFSRGADSLKSASATNPMAKFWFSPEFSQFRLQWVEYTLRKSNNNSGAHPIQPTAENAARILSLLESPMFLGMSSSADLLAAAQSASKAGGDVMDTAGLFMILDISGKSAQFDALWPQIQANVSKDVTRSRSSFSGVTIEIFKSPKDLFLTARSGNYFIWANQQKVIEDLITRLRPGSSPANSLAQDSNLLHCRGNEDAGAIFEVFFRVPDLSKIPLPPNPAVDTAAVMNGLHLNALHAAYASISVTPEGTHSRGVLLADMAAGGIFSLAGTNKPHFDTLALAPSSAYSISAISFDLPAFYKFLRSVIVGALPPDQQSSVGMVEMVGASQLGMSIPDALSLFTGEMSSIQMDVKASSAAPQLLAFTISDSQQLLALIHKVGAQRIANEKQEGDITFVTLATPTPPGGAGRPDPNPYFIGIAPHILLASANANYVRDSAARIGSHDGTSLADNPGVVSLRSALPHDVLALSITDYSRYDLGALVSSTLETQSPQTKNKLSPEDAQFFESMKKFPWSSLRNTLHWSVGAWWKDADGIHFESNSK